MRRSGPSEFTLGWSTTLRILKVIGDNQQLLNFENLCGEHIEWKPLLYTQHYQRYFRHSRRRKLNVWEIGVGGYEDASPKSSMGFFKGAGGPPHLCGVSDGELRAEPLSRDNRGNGLPPELGYHPRGRQQRTVE
jgi:hypothetical protein